MNISQFFSVLRARWGVALLVFVLTVAAAVGLSMLLPKQYTATATMVVDQTRPDPVSGAVFSGNPSPAFTATQIDIMKSDRVALQVIKTLNLTEDAEVKANWQEATKGVGSIETWLTERLQHELDAKPSRESNVISVSYKAGDAAKAAQYANAFVQAYLDTSLRLKVNPAKGNLDFFKARSDELRANLVNAQARLSA
jgi:succinoglycan biosynthesis transport protein ExoP